MANLNDVIHQNFYDMNNKVFCKHLHTVTDGDKILPTCDACPYLAGSLNGDGIECEWEDTSKNPFVQVQDPTAEMLRVSKLIDKGILRKG